MFFKEFYKSFLVEGEKNLRMKLQESLSAVSIESIECYRDLLMRQLQTICMRTLINQMHVYKDKGFLQGKDAKEEYEFFCREIVGKEAFAEELFSEYPVLKSYMKKRIEYTTEYFVEIIENFQNDRELINQVLCNGMQSNKIVHLTGTEGDVHQHGKMVLKIKLDNNQEILYKPRSMENERVYGEMLRWISEKIHISQYEYPIVTVGSHSWCQIVEDSDCESVEQVQEYYRRMGVHLFLAYLLGTHDLHCENLIASGEFPVIIDLETLVHMETGKRAETAEQAVRTHFAQSVLLTGLLPFYKWNQGGKGIDHSAINGKGGTKYLFQIPVVANAGTSDMCIAYVNPYSKPTKNQVKLCEDFLDPINFLTYMTDGFQRAYKLILQSKEEFGDLVKKMKNVQNRILVADTQRYAMLLSLSYHPDLLRDETRRKQIFESLCQRRDETKREIVEYEEKSLQNGDIPYFYTGMEDIGLYSEGEKVKEAYFADTALGSVLQKMDKMNMRDMRRQSEYIELSMKLSDPLRRDCMNKVYDVKEKEEFLVDKQKGTVETIKTLTNRFIENAIWNVDRTEVSWGIIGFSGGKGNTWSIRPMGMYLYDGLAGMLLLAAMMQKHDSREDIKEIYQALREQLFSYTDRGNISVENLMTQKTGAYDGEASLVRVYLLLYEWGGDEEYLEYAGKHADILIQFLEEDASYDLVSGNAGAAQVLLKLYDQTDNEKYLEGAERAVLLLRKSAVKMKQGIGWKTHSEMPPMAGMAHGNAGILLPVVWLWKLTGKEDYWKMAKGIWEYENFLYNPKKNNWADMREEEDREDDAGAVAWCHGAAGILLSRITCYRQVKHLLSEEWRRKLEVDIQRAYEKLSNFWLRDSWCLCHGNGGNLLILDIVEKICGISDERVSKDGMMKKIYLLPQERMNPGMMNGYGGILFLMLRENEKEKIEESENKEK